MSATYDAVEKKLQQLKESKNKEKALPIAISATIDVVRANIKRLEEEIEILDNNLRNNIKNVFANEEEYLAFEKKTASEKKRFIDIYATRPHYIN